MPDSATLKATAHVDSFARDNLPPREQWPEIDLTGVPELAAYPEWLNCAAELLDRQAEVHADRPAFRTETTVWTYRELREKVDRIAHVLVDDLGVVRVHARFYDARALDHSIHYMMVVARQDEGKVEVPCRSFILIFIQVAQRQDEVRTFIS